MNDVYGMNGAEVQKQIRDLFDACESSYIKFNDAIVNDFLPLIKKAWYSPVAAEFSKNYLIDNIRKVVSSDSI